MSTLRDVARLAEVTPSVVSRVVNGDPTLRIRPDTRERVLEAIRVLEYTPNSSARSLRMSRTGILGLVLPDILNPIYAEILTAAEPYAYERGYDILLASTEGGVTPEEHYKRLVSGARIDGILLKRGNTMDDAALWRYLDSPVPTLLINSKLERQPGSVTLDDRTGIAVAVNHLVDLGHRRIGHLGGPPTADTALRRREGYTQAITALGLEYHSDDVVMAGYDVETGATGMTTLLKSAQGITAVVVANVIAGVGALRAAKSLGLNVPHELSIIALHDVWFAEHSHPRLTTVKMPLFELGRESCRQLLNVINGADPADVVISKPAPQICVRDSTAPPPF